MKKTRTFFRVWINLLLIIGGVIAGIALAFHGLRWILATYGPVIMMISVVILVCALFAAFFTYIGG